MRDTTQIHRDQVWELCKLIAPQHKFDPYVILALCEQESEKDGRDALIYRPDVARLEQGYYRRYTEKHPFATTTEILLAASFGITQMMGQSLYELGWFDEDFARQSENYREHHVAVMSETNVTKALNRYCVDPTQQIEAGCRWLARKRKAVGDTPEKYLLAWNGGSNKNYPGEVLARTQGLKKAYGG